MNRFFLSVAALAGFSLSVLPGLAHAHHHKKVYCVVPCVTCAPPCPVAVAVAVRPPCPPPCVQPAPCGVIAVPAPAPCGPRFGVSIQTRHFSLSIGQ